MDGEAISVAGALGNFFQAEIRGSAGQNLVVFTLNALGGIISDCALTACALIITLLIRSLNASIWGVTNKDFRVRARNALGRVGGCCALKAVVVAAAGDWYQASIWNFSSNNFAGSTSKALGGIARHCTLFAIIMAGQINT
jgi:hypothetical protein